MSEAIHATTLNSDHQSSAVHDYVITRDANGRVILDTGAGKDIVELIWNDDKSLTIVINGETAIWLDPDQAKDVFINTNEGDDTIFVTGDTPVGDTPEEYKLVLHGGNGDDIIIGSDGNEQLEGGNGSDKLWGMGGNDHLYSRDTRSSDERTSAVDYMFGGDGNDVLHGHHEDSSHGNDGTDIFHGGITYTDGVDVNESPNSIVENDEELSASASRFRPNSNAENIVNPFGGTTSAEAPPITEAEDPASDPVESDPAADAASDLGPGAPPDDLPVAEPPIGNENMEVPEEPPFPLDASAEERPQLVVDQLEGFYEPTVADLNQASEDSLAQAQLAAEDGDMDAAKAWAAKAAWYASQAERLSASAAMRLELVVASEDPDTSESWFIDANETVQDIKEQAAEARANADEAELIAGGAETENSESESTTGEPAEEEPSASESEAPAAAPSPELPSTLPGGDTAAGQLFHFHDQLTGFYADEISQALDNTQTYAENAETAAASGRTEEAEQWARMAIRESARANELLEQAQARLTAAQQQLDEVLNDPDATPEQKALAQQQFDEAKLAVDTAEDQAAEAAGLAEDARVAAGLPEGDDGSVPPAEEATTEPGAEGSDGSDSEATSATPGAEGSDPEADSEEADSEGEEAPGAVAAGESESSEDPYDQAMDNASEGTNRQESDRRSRGRSGNFLVAMAEALGLMQAKFLGNAMKHLDTMDSLSSEEIPEGDANAERQHREAFLIAQSKFQAEMQMFNIVSQASATSLRSTGEGMAAVVRKN